MLAAQEVYKAVEDTILEYQEEIIRGKRENDQLRRKLLEAGIETWPERQSYECEEQGRVISDQKVEPEPTETSEKEAFTRKGGKPLRVQSHPGPSITATGNADFSPNSPQPTSHQLLALSQDESNAEGPLVNSAYKHVKTETDRLCATNPADDPGSLSNMNLDCSSAQGENCVNMMGLEGDIGLLSGFEALQIPHPEHFHQAHDSALRCTVCAKLCRNLGHLNAHARIHTKEKPFLCALCGKSFSSSGRLKGHQRIHTGEKPYQCHFCRKRFNQTAHLKVHLRVHTGEKPFSCPVCGKSFSQSNKVKRHLVTHSRDRT